MSGNKPILALDVDGVLLRIQKWTDTLNRGHGISEAFMVEHVFAPHWSEVVVGKMPLRSLLEEKFPLSGVDVSVDQLLAYWFDETDNLYHEVFDAASKWRDRTGGEVHLATNQEALRAEFLWHSLDFKSHFDGMNVSHVFKVAKPDPDYFRQSDVHMAVTSPDAVFFIDDTHENVIAAQTHGWRAAHSADPAEIVALIERDG